MKENIKKTKKVASEFLIGMTGDAMKVTGTMANKTAKENTFYPTELKKWGSGVKAEELNGLMGRKT
jgi:translation elongation factor P/translation initiation factor 5A